MEKIRVPEKNKKPDICYAVTSDGVEMPVVDVTNPAFAVTRPEDLQERMDRAIREQEQFNRIPKFLRSAILWLVSRQSTLMRRLQTAHGTFLSGMDTYLLKLGPDNLGQAFSGKLDKTIASSVPAYFVRLRLQEISQLLAGAVAPSLATRPGVPLRFVNIAGGPCMDSLNALTFLCKQKPGLLANRQIRIDVLDLDRAGPAFAGSALEALKAPGRPLHGLEATLTHVEYNWSQPERLREYLTGEKLEKGIAVASSEGGLFDYGSNEEIIANLKVIHEFLPADAVVAGTLTPASGPGLLFNSKTGGARTIPRTLEELKELAARSGWVVGESREEMMHTVFGLRKG